MLQTILSWFQNIQTAQNTTDALFSYGTDTRAFAISGGVGQEADFADGERVALNFSKGIYYVVIIGPNSQKIEALARIVAAKI